MEKHLLKTNFYTPTSEMLRAINNIFGPGIPDIQCSVCPSNKTEEMDRKPL
jgi:hypothetical protein